MKERFWKWRRRIALPGVFTSLAVTALLFAFDITSGFADILREFLHSVDYLVKPIDPRHLDRRSPNSNAFSTAPNRAHSWKSSWSS